MARARFLLGLLSGAVLTGAVGAGGLYAFGGVYAATVLGWPVVWVGVFGIVSAVAAVVKAGA